MPFDSNGTFNRVIPGGWKADAAANIKIRADRHDDEDDGFATGLSSCITKDGRTQPVANIPMNAKRIINLGDPTADTDAANKKYVDNFKNFTTGSVITGADLNGRVTFSSPTGANGLSWTGADLSWLARLATAAGPGTPPVPEATLNRLVLNDKADGTGTDVVEVRDDGSIKAGAITAATVTATDVTASGNVAITGSITATAVTATGQVQGGTVKSTTQVFANDAYLGTDGNTVGSVWLNIGYNDAYTAIVNRIESRAAAYAGNCVQVTRMAGETTWVALTTQTVQPKNQASAYVCTATQGGNGGINFYWRQPQVYIPSQGWLAAFPF